MASETAAAGSTTAPTTPTTMPVSQPAGFADSFWSPDYSTGVNVLFDKLEQGIKENEQLLAVARIRADAEDAYAEKLHQIGFDTEKIEGGFQRDDGASAKNAFDSIQVAMEDCGRHHNRVADKLRELVVDPFGKWCDEHAQRVSAAGAFLNEHIKTHEKQTETVMKLRSQYYNKCRQLEDMEEEDKLAFKEVTPSTSVPVVKVEGEPEQEEQIEIGGREISPADVRILLTAMLDGIGRSERKVAILGTYRDVSSGAEIADWIRGAGASLTGVSSSAAAEEFGQDIVDAGYLRLVGNIGNSFVNSAKYFYQWKPTVFRLTGKKRMLDSSEPSSVAAVSDYLSGWNPLATSDETQAERIRREATESDERYRVATVTLDEMRCRLEEHMMQTFRFMEKCETDRVAALKQVVADVSGAIKSTPAVATAAIERMAVAHEAIQPHRDIRYLLESYRTGKFMPRVQPYENYYSAVGPSAFGIDLEARAKSDRKRVPAIVTILLTHLDQRYPDLDGDAARQAIWLVDVPLVQTHRLRALLNQTGSPSAEVQTGLATAQLPVVAATLKLYLLELPDSVVSSHVYEIVRSLYADTLSPEHRIAVLQSTLGTLHLANIATLDALVTHFTRLIDLTSADEQYGTALAAAIAPCILRPRTQSAVTMTDRHPTALIRDLMAHKNAIFDHLKKAAASQQEILTRPRAISTDESHRGRLVREQAARVAARSRASSPNPAGRGPSGTHKRDRSSGPPAMTRFPVVTSPTVAGISGGGLSSPTMSPKQNKPARRSLEVPTLDGMLNQTTGSGGYESYDATDPAVVGHAGEQGEDENRAPQLST